MGQVGFFILSLFGVILGSVIIRRILYGSPQSHREVAPQYNKTYTSNNNENLRSAPPTYDNVTSNTPYKPQSGVSNISFDRLDKQKGFETELGAKDDPYNRR
jgi:hypothetical protein